MKQRYNGVRDNKRLTGAKLMIAGSLVYAVSLSLCAPQIGIQKRPTSSGNEPFELVHKADFDDGRIHSIKQNKLQRVVMVSKYKLPEK